MNTDTVHTRLAAELGALRRENLRLDRELARREAMLGAILTGIEKLDPGQCNGAMARVLMNIDPREDGFTPGDVTVWWTRYREQNLQQRRQEILGQLTAEERKILGV